MSIDGESPPCKQKICSCQPNVSSWHPVHARAPVTKDTHLVIDQSGQGEIIKQIRKELPDVGVSVLSQTLVVKTVNLGDLTRLVVSSEDGHSVPISELERDEQRDRLDRVVSSVDIVAHEQVVCVGRVASDPEQLRQIVLWVRDVAKGGISHHGRGAG